MGYVSVMGNCFACGNPFCFNPHRVPSFRVNGVRQPVCSNCMSIANEKRVAQGLLPHPIHKDAYEPLNENEL